LIRSPFDAVVLTKDADVGDIVTPLGAAANAKAAVVTIADMDSLQVEADVSESNLQQVKMGQPCEIQMDALPDIRFRGVVHMIVPTADRTKATVLVKVRFVDMTKEYCRR
jgi:multidrug resistance efflux pump